MATNNDTQQFTEDRFLEAYDGAISARQHGTPEEEIEALREAVSAAYDAIYPVVGTSERSEVDKPTPYPDPNVYYGDVFGV